MTTMSPMTLRQVTSQKRLLTAWRTVRRGMRRQVITDLHDHLDIHRSRHEYVARLRNDVLAGAYRPRESTVVRLEKGLGISRKIVLPAPSDAILLQAISDGLEAPVRRASPTTCAYYSQSHPPGRIEEWDSPPEYPWWLQWRQFQERIWGFARAYEWVVITDVANYYDTVPLHLLRNKLAALHAVEERVLDLLFVILEAFVWRPDYIPHSGVGLPQVDFDAPRLLAFAFLFKIDSFLDRRDNTEFVRWMDDIDIGVPDRSEGKRLLGDLDRELNTLGVRINAGKSAIVTAEEAAKYLWIRENLFLNVLKNLMQLGGRGPRTVRRAKERFRLFWNRDRKGMWEKVLKRYITFFTKVNDPYVEEWVLELLEGLPSVRTWVFRYYRTLGYSSKRLDHVMTYVRSRDCVDDQSMFEGMKLLVEWTVPSTSPRLKALRALPDEILVRRKDLTATCSGLWVKAKYASAAQLKDFIAETRDVWTRREWAARQVAAVTPLLPLSTVAKIRREMGDRGLLQGIRVIGHLEEMRQLREMDTQLRMYLRHQSNPYPLYKVLIAKCLLRGNLGPDAEAELQDEMRQVVSDPGLLRLLSSA
jgi:hypothetical protein